MPVEAPYTVLDSDFPVTRKGRYDERILFGPEFYRWRAGLYAALGGVGTTDIAIIGDSMFEGNGPTLPANKPMTVLRAATQERYRSGGEGYVPIIDASAGGGRVLNARFTQTAGGSNLTDFGYGFGRKSAVFNTNASLTFTFTGDRAWVLYTTGGGAGNLRVTVDGVILGTVNTFSSTLVRTGRVVDTGPLVGGPSASHTMVISAPGGAPSSINTIVVDGVMVFSTDGGPAQAFAGGVASGTNWKDEGAYFTAADVTKVINIEGIGTRTISAFVDSKNVTLNASVTTNSGAETYAWSFTTKRTTVGIGVRLWNGSHSGYSSSSYGGTADANSGIWSGALANIRPDMLAIELGLNDMPFTVPIATFKANLLDIVADAFAVLAYTPSVVLIPLWARADVKATGPWNTTGAIAQNVVTSGYAYPSSADIGKTVTGTGVPGSTTITGFTPTVMTDTGITPGTFTLSNNLTAADPAITIVSRTSTYADEDWAPYREAMYDLAREQGYAVWDMYNVVGYIGTDPMGLTSDKLHPSNVGGSLIGNELATLLTGSGKSNALLSGLADTKGQMLSAIGDNSWTVFGPGILGQYPTVAPNSTAGVLFSDWGANRRNVVGFLAQMGATTSTSHGLSAAPTVTSGIAAVNADAADGCWLRISTTATNGNVAKINTPNVVRRDWLPEAAFFAKVGATLTSARHWVGLFSGDPSGSATPSLHLAGFRYDTAADGTAFWRCVTAAGSATQTVTVTTVAVTASAAYRLRITSADANTVDFFINDVLVARHTTNLPTATTALQLWAAVTALSASARTLDVNRIIAASA